MAHTVVIGVLTSFRPQSSTAFERVIDMCWLYLQLGALLLILIWNKFFHCANALHVEKKKANFLNYGPRAILIPVALTGYYVVVEQMKKFGVCVQM